MNKLTSPPKGMREFIPEKVALRKFVYNVIIETYKKYGFQEIETPCVESISLLCRGDGGENEKLLFKILKRGEKLDISDIDNLADLGLRYDLTLPLSRFYANNFSDLPKISKFIQIGNVWRAERPQKGRYRQLMQCDIDIIGEKSVLAELELISATTDTLNEFGLNDYTVKINDRRILQSIVANCGFEEQSIPQVFIILDKLDKIGLTGIENEMLNKGFPSDSISKFLNIITDFQTKSFDDFILENKKKKFADELALEDLTFVINSVLKQSESNVKIEFDLSLVRGMGYYTGLIFEITIPGYSWSIAGGGRYDKLIGKLFNDKQSIPACGFSIGFERVALILEERGFKIPSETNKVVLLGTDNNLGIEFLLKEAQSLRKAGYIVTVDFVDKKIKRQLDEYKSLGFNFFAIIKPDTKLELKSI